MKVIAAIDNSAAARPVLGVAEGVGWLFGSTVEALHVVEDGDEAARAQAGAAGLALRTERDPVVDGIVEAGRRDDVVAVVLGARGTPAGRRPAGHTALEVITSLGKPVVVVPPLTVAPRGISRVLVPLDATPASAAAVQAAVEVACRSDVEIVVAHIYEEDAIPMFEDQPQHEMEAWVREFLARYCPAAADRARMEVRVGAPEREILGVIVDSACDLVAVGWSQDISHGRAAVIRGLLGWSEVPVLLLPIPVEVRTAGRLGGLRADERP